MTSLQSEGGGFASLRQRRWTDCSDIFVEGRKLGFSLPVVFELGDALRPFIPLGVHRDGRLQQRIRRRRHDVAAAFAATSISSASSFSAAEEFRVLVRSKLLVLQHPALFWQLKGLIPSISTAAVIDHLQGILLSNFQISQCRTIPPRLHWVPIDLSALCASDLA